MEYRKVGSWVDTSYIATQESGSDSKCRNHGEINLNSKAIYFILTILKLRDIPKWSSLDF